MKQRCEMWISFGMTFRNDFSFEGRSTNGKLVIWVGGLDIWCPLVKRDCYLEVSLESQTTNAPNHQLIMSCENLLSENKMTIKKLVVLCCSFHQLTMSCWKPPQKKQQHSTAISLRSWFYRICEFFTSPFSSTSSHTTYLCEDFYRGEGTAGSPKNEGLWFSNLLFGLIFRGFHPLLFGGEFVGFFGGKTPKWFI